MAIVPAELVPYYALHRNQADPAANGGRPSANIITSNVEGNVWPSMTTAKLAAGQTIAEKICIKNRNAANAAGSDPWIALAVPNPTDEVEWIVAADQDSLQSALTGSERKYSAAKLAVDAAAGATSIVLTLDDVTLASAWQNGDGIVVYSGQTGLAATTGVKEFRTVSGVPTLSGSQLTITLSAALTNAHTVASGAIACTRCFLGSPLAPRAANPSQTGTGTYDLTTYPIVLGNLGTIRQRWTLTYQAGGLAELSGDTLGSLGSFAITADIAPLNPATGTPYLTIKAAGHGTAHVAGDKLMFDTYEAAAGCWWFKKTPAGAAAMPLTISRLACGCETVV